MLGGRGEHAHAICVTEERRRLLASVIMHGRLVRLNGEPVCSDGHHAGTFERWRAPGLTRCTCCGEVRGLERALAP